MKKFFFILLSTFIGSGSLGGVKEVGNGAENFQYQDGSAWFYQHHRTLKICYKVEKAFEKIVPRARIVYSIQSAFDTWNDYLKAKDIRPRAGAEFYPQNIDIASSCKGDEDLVFKFGTMDKQVTEYVKKYSRPVSFAVRTSYDAVQLWGKGFVWIAPQEFLGYDHMAGKRFPDWSVPDTVEGALLHEVGHIYGNAHVSGTIMDEEFARGLKIGASPLAAEVRQKTLRQIDQRRELRVCSLCDFKQVGVLGSENRENGTIVSKRRDNFKLLTGRDAVGKIKSEFVIENKVTQLVVSDDQSREVFVLTPKKGRYHATTRGPFIFKYAQYNPQQPAVLGGVYEAGADMSAMTLTTLTGKNLSVRVERNIGGFSMNELVEPDSNRQIDSSLVQIIYDTEDEIIPLFAAGWRGETLF